MNSKASTILNSLKALPYFRLEDLTGLCSDKSYLKIICSRYAQKGKLIRLKKNLYTSQDFLTETQRRNTLSSYTEFLANLLYPPSYLSLEYILYQYQILTDVPQHFTSVTPRKTNHFTNALGTFYYHTLQNKLFYGYTIELKNNYQIATATKSKALFDYLYLRKNILTSPRALKELRLNLNQIASKDRRELKRFIEHEGSQKMKSIFSNLWR
jgi:predicted transcriptional regulator of viral defense system